MVQLLFAGRGHFVVFVFFLLLLVPGLLAFGFGRCRPQSIFGAD